MKLNAHLITGAIIPIEGPDEADLPERLSRALGDTKWIYAFDSNVFLNLDHVAALVPPPEPSEPPAGREALIDQDSDFWFRSDTDPGMWKNDEVGSRSRDFIEKTYGPVRRVQIMELDD